MSYNYNHPVAGRDCMQYVRNVRITMLSNIKINAPLDSLLCSQYDSVPYIHVYRMSSATQQLQQV